MTEQNATHSLTLLTWQETTPGETPWAKRTPWLLCLLCLLSTCVLLARRVNNLDNGPNLVGISPVLQDIHRAVIGMPLRDRSAVRHPPVHERPVEFLPHVQTVRDMPSRRRVDGRVGAPKRVVVNRVRAGTVAVAEVPPRMHRLELGDQVAIDAFRGKPGRRDDVNVTVPREGCLRRRPARDGLEMVRPGGLARRKGLAIGGEDVGV